MAQVSSHDDHGNSVYATYQNNGFFYGCLLGLLVGVIIAGPYFFEWSLTAIVLSIAGSSVVIGFLGFCAVALAATELTMPDQTITDSAESSMGGDSGD